MFYISPQGMWVFTLSNRDFILNYVTLSIASPLRGIRKPNL